MRQITLRDRLRYRFDNTLSGGVGPFYEGSTLLGLVKKNGQVELKPAMDTVVEKGDSVVVRNYRTLPRRSRLVIPGAERRWSESPSARTTTSSRSRLRMSWDRKTPMRGHS
jgi:hypothetical protein